MQRLCRRERRRCGGELIAGADEARVITCIVEHDEHAADAPLAEVECRCQQPVGELGVADILLPGDQLVAGVAKPPASLLEGENLNAMREQLNRSVCGQDQTDATPIEGGPRMGAVT